MDPRAQRSREALREALLMLIKEKPYDDIQIAEIAECADTGRVTFYRHYGSKDELLIDFLTQVYDDFVARIDAGGPWNVLDFNEEPPMQDLFALVQEDRLLFKRLLTGPIISKLEVLIRDYIIERILCFDAEVAPFEAHFIASAVIGNLKWWLAEDLPHSPAAMARTTHWLSISGVMAMRGELDRVTMPGPAMRAGTPYAE